MKTANLDWKPLAEVELEDKKYYFLCLFDKKNGTFYLPFGAFWSDDYENFYKKLDDEIGFSEQIFIELDGLYICDNFNYPK